MDVMTPPFAVDECGSSHESINVHMHQKHSHPKQPVLLLLLMISELKSILQKKLNYKRKSENEKMRKQFRRIKRIP